MRLREIVRGVERCEDVCEDCFGDGLACFARDEGGELFAARVDDVTKFGISAQRLWSGMEDHFDCAARAVARICGSVSIGVGAKVAKTSFVAGLMEVIAADMVFVSREYSDLIAGLQLPSFRVLYRNQVEALRRGGGTGAGAVASFEECGNVFGRRRPRPTSRRVPTILRTM